MPSFDAVSEVDMHEVTNAVDQAKRELSNRWDFKNVDVDIVLENSKLTFSAEQDFQLEQVVEVAKMALAKRKVDSRAMVEAGDSKAGKLVKKTFDLKQGIDSLTAKKMVKLVKESKIKVQAAIQGEKVRVTGKKRDDLQQVMALWKESDIEVPLQYNNFRD
ncbi:YajQ family cyclic di-GMP-binding protein [Oleiphilus sp. HI0009]|nr:MULTISPECIES: YajQ family cyclic di-GMP-binding protein [unclassified Oleiphilus]KZX80354.1 YajQ family cyclic di-GMP-binding protein [Oleiphilus sp. HI0009]KZX81356.1 YajQ family cyclic di-GMP-binding protein [Oleiphilus sp. HI0009]KZY63275.1 YajQ family cyclic di-GMP-binding protein [Oleiphilus sp. HI0066]KZY70812.1 YajQ family cyclic di-GMP-binding protein [Oleiphilus sp. HI0067]